MRTVLDTNVVSALMHRIPEVLSRLRTYHPNDVFLTSPVAAEIAFGMERLEAGSRRQLTLTAQYDRLRDAVEWLDWTESAAQIFGEQKAALQSAGQPIEDMDIVVGSIALDFGASVATFNARHLSRLSGLTVDDWGSPQVG